MKSCFSDKFICFTKRWTSIILFLYLQNSLFSQEHAAEKFTIKEGLVSNEVYDLLQDKDGFIWIGTDKGVCRFDGSKITVLTKQDGITDNDILSVKQDSKGRVWFLSYNGQLSYWKEGKVFNPSNSSILENINAGSYFHSFLEDSENNLWFGTSKSGWLRIDSSFKSIDKTALNSEVKGGSLYLLFENADMEVFLIRKKSILKFSENSFTPYADLPIIRNKSRFYYSKKNNILYFAVENEVFSYQLSEKKVLWSKKIANSEQVNRIELMSDGLLYIATDNGFYSFNEDGVKLNNYLIGNKVSDVLIDKENNLWAATLYNGVFIIRNRNVINYNTEATFSIKEKKGSIFFGGTGPKLHYLTNNRIATYPLFDSGPRAISNQEKIRVLKEGPTNRLWVGTAKGLYRVNGNNSELILYSPVFDFFFYNQLIYIASKFGLVKLDSSAIESLRLLYEDNKDWNKIGFSTRQLVSNYVVGKRTISNFSAVNDKLPLFGSKDSIYEYSDSLLIPLTGISDGEIVQSERIKEDDFCFLDKWKGLFYYDKKKKNLSNILLNYSKGGIEYNSLIVDNDSTIWVASSIGLFRVDIRKNDSFVSLIGANEGLINTEINDVRIINDTIWLGTSKGVSYFSKYLFKDTIAPILYLDSIQLNGSLIRDSSSIESTSDKNKLELFLTTISFKDKESIQYHYKLEGNTIDSGYFNSSNFTLNNLPPSEYKLTITAFDPSANRSLSREFSFSIKTPWWYNKVIWSVILLISILGFVLLIRKRRQYQNLVEKNSISKPSITVKSVLDGSKVQIYLDELLYIKGAKDYLEIFSAEKKIMVRITMKAFLKSLEEAPEFIRVHKSYIVNSQKVSSYKSDSLHIGDEIIPIGRSFQNQVRAFLDSLASD